MDDTNDRWCALEYASDALKRDRAFMMEATSKAWSSCRGPTAALEMGLVHSRNQRKLGGRFGYFLFFFCLGVGEREEVYEEVAGGVGSN